MKRARIILIALLMLGTVGCDQLTKHIAKTELEGSLRLSYLGDTVRLEYTENPGAFLGLGAEWSDSVQTGFLVAGAALALAGLAIAAIHSRWAGLPLLGALLVIAAGSSNLVDRIVRGSVVDFMNVGVGSIRTGIFNVADIALIIGIALIAFGSNVQEWFGCWGTRR